MSKSKQVGRKLLGAGILLAGAVALNGNVAKAAGDVAINETNFPDAVFRNYVWQNFDQDQNGYLSETEIGNVTKIDVSGKILEIQVDGDTTDFSQYESNGVKSVKGIEFFPNLKTLECSCNDITELDVSKNTALESLGCSHNKLTLLDLYSNPNLDHLSCAFNNTYYVDIRNCPKLQMVYERGYSMGHFAGSMAGLYYPGMQYDVYDEARNYITSYYLSTGVYVGTSESCLVDVAIDEFFPDPVFNKYVKEHFDRNGDGTLSGIERGNVGAIDCSGTTAQNGGIKSLEGVQYFPYIESLNCGFNQINSLDVKSNKDLAKLYCNNNPLKTLRLTEDPEAGNWDYDLREVICENCELTELDIRSRCALENAFQSGKIISGENVITFQDPEYNVILELDEGVKIISRFERNPESVAVNTASILLEKGKSQKLEATVLPGFADQTVTWSSNNTKVANVDTNGNVTFKGAGTATITVKTVNGLTATCEVTCLVENIESNPFADIASDNWAFASMKDMLDKKIMVGTGELAGKIVSGCDNVLTRAQFARILYSMENEPAVEYSDVFSDVSDGMWYTKPIMWANANKLIVGKGSYFDIDAPATREQIATILKRYAEFKGLDVSVAEDIDEKIAGFSDKGSISSWAEDGLSWAISHEIMFGKPNSVLDPNGKATRAECAAMISRFLNNIK